jgi:hypothetical protein
MNGFQIAVQNVSSKPEEQPHCTLSGNFPWSNYGVQVPSWSSGVWFSADTQSLTTIVGPGSPIMVAGVEMLNDTYTKYTATAVTMDGILSSTGNHTEFALNGTNSTLMMSDTQWATLMMDVICNATLPYGTNVVDFGIAVNDPMYNLDITKDEIWTSLLGGIIGSYTTANQNQSETTLTWPFVDVSVKDLENQVLHLYYGAYVLIANIVISIIMLSIAWRCGCELHPTLLDSTHILLDTSRNVDISLVNESVARRVKVLGNPCLKVNRNGDSVEITQSRSSPR